MKNHMIQLAKTENLAISVDMNMSFCETETAQLLKLIR